MSVSRRAVGQEGLQRGGTGFVLGFQELGEQRGEIALLPFQELRHPLHVLFHRVLAEKLGQRA